MKRRIISFMMTAVMLIGNMLPAMQAYAEEAEIHMDGSAAALGSLGSATHGMAVMVFLSPLFTSSTAMMLGDGISLMISSLCFGTI